MLRVPLRKPVKLALTSNDVIHSLYIPAFRIKEDAVPRFETHLWFVTYKIGSYELFCAEYCGLGHSKMLSKVEILPEEAFDKWYQGVERKEKGIVVKKKKDSYPRSFGRKNGIFSISGG